MQKKTCFFQHKIEGFNCYPQTEISGYLKQHLSRKRTAFSAAKVDKNHSSALVIRSERSGMGKIKLY